MARGTRRSMLAVVMAGIFGLGIVAGGGLLSGSASAARQAAANCEVGSLVGAFGVRFDGRSENLGLFASVSRFQFDGAGSFRAVENYNAENTGPHRRKIEGDYDMHGNCTFHLLFPSELGHPHEAFGVCVLEAQGSQFDCLDVEEGWVTTGTGTKI